MPDYRIEPNVTIHDSKALWSIRITIIEITIGKWKLPVEWWEQVEYDTLEFMDPRLPEFWFSKKKQVFDIVLDLISEVNNPKQGNSGGY